jgi:hypothetical protein
MPSTRLATAADIPTEKSRARFALATSAAMSPPAKHSIASYPVQVVMAG